MTRYSKTGGRKASFPSAIFLVIFIIQLTAAAGGIFAYFYSDTKDSIADIEGYTVNYSKTMAEAFASVAELSYRTKNYSSLKSLFREKIEENTIDEAFFVLQNGTLIVHSNTTTEKRLRGNIANDEMSYNLDMILQPVKSGSRDLFFSNYNIIDQKIPFNRSEREIIQKYLYRDINTSGWLFTKAVFHKNKPVGSVNFIVDKGRIHNSIHGAIDNIQKSLLIASAAALAISFITALIIMIRFRKTAVIIDNKPENEATGEDFLFEDDIDIPLDNDEEITAPLLNSLDDETDETVDIDLSLQDEITPLSDDTYHDRSAADEDEYITIELLGELEDEPASHAEKKQTGGSPGYRTIASVVVDDAVIWNPEIPDAIPVRKEK